MNLAPASLPWFARHELRLHWRELTAMVTGGKRRRAIGALIGLLAVGAGAHYVAWIWLSSWYETGLPDPVTLYAQLTGAGLLFATMSLSQALESITRAYYTRHDLDLILSSPASARKLFTVRTGAVAATSMLLTGLIVSPAVNALILLDGPRWLAAYAVIGAISLFTTGLAISITLGLFRIAGLKRTRTIAQVVAALVGASLIVGIQLAVILSTGTTSGIGQSLSGFIMNIAPNPQNPLWLPARAATGDPAALIVTLAIPLLMLAALLPGSSNSFARLAIAATGLNQTRHSKARRTAYAYRDQRQLLRRKEFKLLARDPWLLSQSLMQLFYLLPPAILLWLNFGSETASLPIAVAIIVMAAGQLAGGLAWLTISGEDAYDLVMTAPLARGQFFRAKVEAVITVIAAVTLPLLAALALFDWQVAVRAGLFIGCATASSIAIQLMFRVKAKRSQFARRQTASRIATFIEAFISINWAGAAGLAAVNPAIGAVATLPALVILGITWLVRRNAPPA